MFSATCIVVAGSMIVGQNMTLAWSVGRNRARRRTTHAVRKRSQVEMMSRCDVGSANEVSSVDEEQIQINLVILVGTRPCLHSFLGVSDDIGGDEFVYWISASVQ